METEKPFPQPEEEDPEKLDEGPWEPDRPVNKDVFKEGLPKYPNPEPSVKLSGEKQDD